MEITMPKGIYERNETHREIQSMGGKAAASKEALTCPRCGKVGKGNGMVGHIRLQLDCNVERLCARDGCGKVLKKDKRSLYCSISCHKIDLYKEEENRKKTAESIKNSDHAFFTTPGEFAVKEYLESLGFQHNKAAYHAGPNHDRQVRMDFYHPELKINIEIDGKSHDFPEAQRSDANRDRFLGYLDIQVIRIPDKDLTPQIVESVLRNSNLEVKYPMKEFNLWLRNLRMQQRP
jgi:very-short-patch-repair endonuclease